MKEFTSDDAASAGLRYKCCAKLSDVRKATEELSKTVQLLTTSFLCYLLFFYINISLYVCKGYVKTKISHYTLPPTKCVNLSHASGKFNKLLNVPA